jgi:NAD(P)H-nitrite reductase large subunit
MTPVAGRMIRDWCVAKGVNVHLSARVTSIRHAGGAGDALVARLDSGEELETDAIIVAAGVRPNVECLEGSGITCATGVVVDATLQSSVPGVFAAGDVAEALNFSTGKHAINAIQPSAVEQARQAACNMAGQRVASRGNLTLNVLDTIGLVSSSFGQWWGDPGGESTELVDPSAFRYLCLQFRDDVLIGATSIGLTEHVGVLRGLIEGRVRLGPWKDRLLREPLRITEAYLAGAQAAA